MTYEDPSGCTGSVNGALAMIPKGRRGFKEPTRRRGVVGGAEILMHFSACNAKPLREIASNWMGTRASAQSREALTLNAWAETGWTTSLPRPLLRPSAPTIQPTILPTQPSLFQISSVDFTKLQILSRIHSFVHPDSRDLEKPLA